MDAWTTAPSSPDWQRPGPQGSVPAARPARGRVGPNAVTRVVEALERRHGSLVCAQVFEAAGLRAHLVRPPTGMVDEADVARLQVGLRTVLGPEASQAVGREAGLLTGDYLLQNRIPRLAQALLRHLPRGLAARLLVRAIARHAWTFAGSGRFDYGHPSLLAPALELRITHSPLCRALRSEEPACAYFAATFERVFSAMLGPTVRVTETECAAAGAPACRFIVRW